MKEVKIKNMKCLVKIYDTNQINNLVSILAFKPQTAIFLYDKNKKRENLEYLEKACIERLPNLNFEFYAIDIQNLDSIKRICRKIIKSNFECAFDITGGDELSVIGAYLACADSSIPIFKLDLESGKFINVAQSELLSSEFNLPILNLKTILMSKGATLENGLHPTPDEKQFGSILSFCDKIFENIDLWKELCSYIQFGMKDCGSVHKELKFDCIKETNDIKSKLPQGSEIILEYAEELGLIKDLKLLDERVSFNFINENIKKYMMDFGSWLELYTYISLVKSGLFNDIKMSAQIIWGGIKENRELKENKGSSVENEIDVSFFHGITPVFVSCKISCPDSEAIQELDVYSNYFGGKSSKCILVTTSDVKEESPRVLKRAKEMGIEICDYFCISSGKLVEKIQKILQYYTKK